ncbi:helix-turn-helix domain-containing protein [Methylobacterium sp. P1-11]|uniref:helix-turn-helix domain-containing protein n=1 Tax=Methylobacterium sp. P1-11 TaxID=2024616 RepID=UPI0011EE874D|nr:helix-turn-helix domain-containing protein [Methylobacterium sp. P1-11]KAA0121847.1 helix-turn-helix domain-containing protein [Methylobacterium sp. P1-11]
MQTLFSTEGTRRQNNFKIRRETLSGRGLPIELERLEDVPFHAKIEAATVGSINLTRLSQGAVRANTSQAMLWRSGQANPLIVIFQLADVLKSLQDDRSSEQRAGDLVVLDHRPGVLSTSAGHRSLYLELPRERLEKVLGPARLFTTMTVGAILGATSLARTFFLDLIKNRHQLSPDTALRMSEIGIDLIVACLAERISQEAPRPIHGTLLVQRAKVYVEANLGDPALDPRQLAVAMGVSLRRLQELFHERGQHISDWIWERRLALAANRLADRYFLHLPVGTVAYGCGFSTQSHFCRRFKDRFGSTPTEYRQASRQHLH